MTDDQTPAPEAGDEVVQTEAEQTPAPEAAESTEGQDVTQPAEVSDDTEEKSKSAQRRERRKAHQKQLEEQAAKAEADAQEAKRQLEAKRQAAQGLKKPNQADFPDFEDYQAAVSAYHVLVAQDERELAQLEQVEAARAQAVTQAQQLRHAEVAQNWEAQIAEAKGRYPDFEAVAMRGDLPIGQDMAEMIMSSDNAADLAYALGKQPDLVYRIADMSPVHMAREIGRVEASLGDLKPKTNSSAPPPINPVTGTAKATLDPSKMSNAEYRAARERGEI